MDKLKPGTRFVKAAGLDAQSKREIKKRGPKAPHGPDPKGSKGYSLSSTSLTLLRSPEAEIGFT